MNAAEEIFISIDRLKKITARHPDDGDWWGCVQNAVLSLEEALRSRPPGFRMNTEDATIEGKGFSFD